MRCTRCLSTRRPPSGLSPYRPSPLLLAGCKHSDSGEQVLGWSMVDAAQRHPIMVTQAPTNLDVEVTRGRHGLAPDQRASRDRFPAPLQAREHDRQARRSRLRAARPTRSSAVQAAGIVKGLARSEGIGWNEIQVEPYSSEEGNPQPPLRISFVRHSAEAPDCGRFPANLAEEPRNLPYANFGCATQRNLASMVANPQDLLGPRTEQRRAAPNAATSSRTSGSRARRPAPSVIPKRRPRPRTRTDGS